MPLVGGCIKIIDFYTSRLTMCGPFCKEPQLGLLRSLCTSKKSCNQDSRCFESTIPEKWARTASTAPMAVCVCVFVDALNFKWYC